MMKLSWINFEESSGEEDDNEVEEGADSEEKEEKRIHDICSGVQTFQFLSDYML